jgi:hypothetical protein
VLGAAGGCAAFLGYGLWDSMMLGNLPALAVWALLGLLTAAERATCPRRSYFLTVLQLLRLALTAACSWVCPLLRSLMMILTWASVAVIRYSMFLE